MLMLTVNELNWDSTIGCLARGFRAGLLLLRNTRPRPGGQENAQIVESRRSTVQGIEYDLYEPQSPPKKTFIMMAGLTLLGERDPRLVNFARSFAESGFRVAAPALPGLKTFRYEVDDLTAMIDLVTALNSRYGGAIGITAFSAGAGLALTVATDPTLAGIVDPLLLFGPYYSLPELWHTIVDRPSHTPASDDEWNHYIWIQLVLAFRVLDSLDLDQSEKSELIDLLENYCWEPSLERKKLFYEQTLKGQSAIHDQTLDDQALQELSPCGKLGKLTSRVLILHDSHDPAIPPQHSKRIYDELCLRGIPGAQKLLVTPLLSHVTARAAWRVFDLFPILGIIGEIFR